MKQIMAIALALIVTQANADALDTAAQGVGDNVVKPLGDQISKRMLTGMAQGKGVMAEAARKNLKEMELAEKEENRDVRRTVKECIKPGNVIDDDVQECVRGYRQKTW